MAPSSDIFRRGLPAFGAAVRVIILFVTVVSVPLTVAQGLELSAGETSSWILVVYGLPSLISLALAVRYRQPLLITGGLFALVFINSLGTRLAYPELIGAFILAGAGVALVSALGLTGRLAAWIPAPIVFGLLTGAIIPFISDTFTALGEAPALVGGTVLAYFVGRYLLGPRIPAILPALLAGLAVAVLTGQIGQAPGSLSAPAPVLTMPVFSLDAIATATPVLVVLITAQANLPSVVFLESQGYRPPEQVVGILSGLGTLAGSLLGPVAVSVSLPATALVAAPEAGEHRVRHWAVYPAAAAGLLIGLLGSLAAALPAIIPLSLLVALAGLSLVGVLVSALQKLTQGPLVLGPAFALAISLSDITLLGLGPFFWALVIGTGVSLLLEREEWLTLRAL